MKYVWIFVLLVFIALVGILVFNTLNDIMSTYINRINDIQSLL